MKYQAHRGVSTEFPENTLPAFRAAAAQGYDLIELDPCFTADGVPVVLHDATLNRTCRNADGTAIAEEIKIGEIPYAAALRYDAGICMGHKHHGTTIPMLAEVLALAKDAGLTAKLDNKIQAFTAAQTEILFDTVARSGAKVAFTCSELAYLEKVAARFPQAQIHYDGIVDEPSLQAIRARLRGNRLTVWLRLPSARTSRSQAPAADEHLCALAKQYGELGLWIADTDAELAMAEALGADVIETAGRLKPHHSLGGFVDCHTHTRFSHDSVAEPTESVCAAREKRLASIAFTDHCDLEFCREQDVQAPILRAVQAAEAIGGYVLRGVEAGEAIWHPAVADAIVRAADYDIVLGSVHAVRFGTHTSPYSTIDFSAFTKDEIKKYLAAYFDDMREMIATADFDVLAHLTCPLRYITGKYGIAVTLADFQAQIDVILAAIIEKGIALEVNTSCLGSPYDCLMPSREILARYKALGGDLLTLGSDAHLPARVAHRFDCAAQTLRAIGFRRLYTYKKRVPIPYDL